MADQAGAKMTLMLFSFAMIVVGAIFFIMGIYFIFGAGSLQNTQLLSQKGIGYSADELALGMNLFMAGVIVMTISGLISILAGIFGIRAVSHPATTALALGAGIATTLLAIADLVLTLIPSPITTYADETLTYGDPVQFATSLVMSIIAIIVSIIFLIMIGRVHRQHRDASAA